MLVPVFVVALFTLTPSLAIAQIYKCPSGGSTVFQQMPCDGGKKLAIRGVAVDKPEIKDKAELKDRSSEKISAIANATEANQRNSVPAEISPVQNSGACPTPLEIKNAETSASSVTISVDEKVAKMAVVFAMKKCPGKITCSDILSLSPNMNTKVAYLATQRVPGLFGEAKQPYRQLDSNSNGKFCEAFK